MKTRHALSRRAFLKAACATAALHSLFPGRLAALDEETRSGTFAPDIGVCTSIKNADVLRRSGAAYIEANTRGLLAPDKDDAAVAAQLEAARACGLPILASNCFLPGSLKSTGPEADHTAVLAYSEVAFRRAAEVGIETIVFGSSGSRTLPEGFDRRTAELQFAALLGKMGILAERHGVVVALEPLHRGETKFINTVEEGAAIVGAVDHPNIRLLADVFHMLRMDEPPEHITAASKLLRHIHIAEKRKRTPPGSDGDDFRPYLRALKECGYTGRISIECGWKDMDAQLPVAVKALREQMAEL